jgi:hypothetical protein
MVEYSLVCLGHWVGNLKVATLILAFHIPKRYWLLQASNLISTILVGKFIVPSLLNFFDGEDLFGMGPLVYGQLAGLTEACIAPWLLASIRFLTRMDVQMVFKILGQ